AAAAEPTLFAAADPAGQSAAGRLSPADKRLLARISYYPIHIDRLLDAAGVGEPSVESPGKSPVGSRAESRVGSPGEAPGQPSPGKLSGGDLYLGLTNLLRSRLIEKLPGNYYQRI
ncbi:MAG: hypothetical protein LBK98_09960, partial [Peptococcaceae bacterium]|nr:hypothetical protein [Peptococcaceae bacterium]